jgi:hypothetical protein
MTTTTFIIAIATIFAIHYTITLIGFVQDKLAEQRRAKRDAIYYN